MKHSTKHSTAEVIIQLGNDALTYGELARVYVADGNAEDARASARLSARLAAGALTISHMHNRRIAKQTTL